MNIETIFKKEDAREFCEEVVTNVALRDKITNLVLYSFGGSALYGVTMGLHHSPLQALSSSVKVFCLFFLTLAICLPTLHFLGLLFGSTMKFLHTFTLLLSGIALNSLLLGAFAPISVFFLVSGSRYEFLILLHVAIFIFCGIASLFSIKRNMDFVTTRVETKPAGAPERTSNMLLQIWFIVYMFIGAQMSYILAPFIGRDQGFALFASDKGDFFSYVFKMIMSLMGNGS